jgi:hypothetical protein
MDAGKAVQPSLRSSGPFRYWPKSSLFAHILIALRLETGLPLCMDVLRLFTGTGYTQEIPIGTRQSRLSLNA